jgi:hypothetical protein
MKRAKFALGQIVATPGAIAVMKTKGIDGLELWRRHVTGDWVTWTRRTSRRMSYPYRKDFVSCQPTVKESTSCGLLRKRTGVSQRSFGQTTTK